MGARAPGVPGVAIVVEGASRSNGMSLRARAWGWESAGIPQATRLAATTVAIVAPAASARRRPLVALIPMPPRPPALRAGAGWAARPRTVTHRRDGRRPRPA